MNKNLLGNFTVTNDLETHAAVKIQSMLRCLDDNTETIIELVHPEKKGGNSICFTIVYGNDLDIDDCCALREVTRVGNRLEA